MKRPGPTPDGLLNLPLSDASDRPAPLEVQDLLPFDAADSEELVDDQVSVPDGSDERVDFPSRFKAGLLDLGAVAGTILLAAVGSWILGAELGLDSVAAFLLFATAFSFLYTIVPLTFWGRTPGMAAFGLVARTRSQIPLTIQQSIRRWVGAVLTVLLLGLPLLLALTGRSLADRLSASRVSWF